MNVKGNRKGWREDRMLNWCLGREQGLIFRERGENFGFRYVVYGIEFPILVFFFAKTFIYSEKLCFAMQFRSVGAALRIYIHIWIMSIWVTHSSSCKYIFIYKRAVLSLRWKLVFFGYTCITWHHGCFVFNFVVVCLFVWFFWIRWCLLRTFIVVFFLF